MKFENKSFDYKKHLSLISFLLTILCMILFFVVNNMFFGGDFLPMRSDNLQGEFAALRSLARDIVSGENIWFAYNMGTGVNNAMVAALLLSPFNILHLLMVNVDPNIVTILILTLKVACIALSFSFFSRKVLKEESIFTIIFSVFYSMCAYVIAYGTVQTTWLDSLIILPLLCKEIINCVKNKKRVLLIILYFYLFVSQYYTAYMVGIFSLVFFLLYLFLIFDSSELQNKRKFYFETIMNWIMSVVIAIMLSSVVWAPTLFFILGNRAKDSTSIVPITATLFNILNSFYWGIGYGIDGTYGYLYCGIPSIILFPLLFLNKKISNREKIFWSILIGFFVISMIFTPLNTVLHVFDQPDNFWYRYSFVISFCFCCVALRMIGNIKEIEKKHLIIVSSSLVIFYLFMQQSVKLWDVEEAYSISKNSNLGLIVNSVFIALWSVGIFFYINKPTGKIRGIISCLLIVICVIEVVSSTRFEISPGTSRSDFYDWYNNSHKAILDIKAKDKGLYRVTNTNSMLYNADLFLDYNGISDFTDEEKQDVRTFLSNIGFATSPRFTDESGYTPVSEMLMGIKYNIINDAESSDGSEEDISINELDLEELISSEGLDYVQEGYIENEYALSFAYLVNADSFLFGFQGRNVFENMNDIVSSFTGIEEDCFKEVEDEKINYEGYEIEKYEYNNISYLKRSSLGGYYNIYVDNFGIDDVYCQIEKEIPGNYIYDCYIFGAQNLSAIFDENTASLSIANKMGYSKDKDKYYLTLAMMPEFSQEYFEFTRFNIYYLDKKALGRQYNALSEGQLIISDYSNGHIKGNVHVGDDKKLLFITIPYDPGWKIKVNGIDTEIIRMVDGAYMGVFVPYSGDVEISMDYECPGLKIGLIVSLLGLLCFISVVFEKYLKKQKK